MTLGYEVAAVEPVEDMVRAAAEAESANTFGAACLPFNDAKFDLVLAYDVLMDVEDIPAALRGFRRVLRPTGSLIISIVRPLVD